MIFIRETFLVLMGFLLASFSGWGQQATIEVLDHETGQPVPYVHVRLHGLQQDYEKYLVTDDKGKAGFQLDQKAVLRLSYVGYEDVHDTINPAAQKRYFLVPKAFNMEEVVVTGQYTPQRSDRSVYKINVLDNAEIKSTASNNLQEILSTELNFKIGQDNILGSSLSLQGVSGENVKILIDGVPVIGRMNGNLDLSQINLNNVERIEIVEGPMSVNYGTNALAGAINIITKDRAEEGVSASVSTFYESVGRYNADAEVTRAGEKGQWRLSAGRNFFDGYSVIDTGRRQEWKPKEQWFTDLKYKRQINRLTLRTSTDFFYETVLDKGSPSLATDTAGNYYYFRGKDGYYNTLRAGQKAFLTGMLGENSYVDLSFAYSHYRREKEMRIKNLYTGTSQLSANEDDADTISSNAWQFRGTLSRYRNRDTRFKYQLGYEATFEDAAGSKIESNKKAISNVALFASIKYNLWDDFLMQAGGRIAYNSVYDSPVTPSVNIKYDVADGIVWRASYGKGFRAPSIKELYLDFKDLNHDIRGNQNLGAERSDNLQSGLVFKSDRETFGYKIEPGFFYNAIDNRIGLIERTELQNLGSQVDTALYYTYDNFNMYKTLGFRIKFHYEHRRKVFFTAGYSNVGILNRFTDATEKQDFVFTPEYVLQMRYVFTSFGTQASLNYKYNGELERHRINFDDEYVTYRENDYHMLDVTFSQDFLDGRLNLVAGAKNLFDVNNIRTTGTGGGVHASGGSSRSVAWGRTFFVDITYNF